MNEPETVLDSHPEKHQRYIIHPMNSLRLLLVLGDTQKVVSTVNWLSSNKIVV